MSTTDWTPYEGRIAGAATLEALDAIEQELFGRKQGAMTLALKALGNLSPDERRVRGAELNAQKQGLEEQLQGRRTELRAASRGSLADTDPLDVTLTLPRAPRGHLHLVPEFIRSVEGIFGRMGFDVADGTEIETEEYNFDLLNIPADHPARDAQDTFWVRDSGIGNRTEGERLVLRTHTSPVQIRYMHAHTPPLRMICPGRVYRKDADATHSPMFHQFEGLMVDRHISLGHMKGVMIEAMRALLGGDIEFRFRSSYFPFVEPGLEVDVRWRGGAETKEGRWLEVVGCGMVHPQVLKNGGLDPDEWRGFAFGFGVERLVMIKHGIRDLRMLYEGDMRFAEQF
ncbi:MAG: phenylalanyl-tRNA synthetase subunit alpha [Candidatus Peregrinibacteria bacterium Gr01-1014_25]|nr:MAG: phenylalanyl-tRNA synthetase subunit alpha [Candidatus Peregrinibacteria bacterium Gr01-1014_25]